jgi:hypothetical protein
MTIDIIVTKTVVPVVTMGAAIIQTATPKAKKSEVTRWRFPRESSPTKVARAGTRSRTTISFPGVNFKLPTKIAIEYGKKIPINVIQITVRFDLEALLVWWGKGCDRARDGLRGDGIRRGGDFGRACIERS